MQYFDGDIISVKNIIFKDTNTTDLRINGHPCVIPTETRVDEKYLYFFTMTSHPRDYAINKDSYIPIDVDKTNNLKKPSFINIRFAYKKEKAGFPCRGSLCEKDYKKMIRGIEDCCGALKDDDYLEVEERIRGKYRGGEAEAAATK